MRLRFIFLLPILLLLSACGKQNHPVTRQLIAMDTAMTFTAYGNAANDAVKQAAEEVQRLDALLDCTEKNSVLSQLNVSGQETVGEEICQILTLAQSYTNATEGAFDVTIAPAVSAWGFHDAQYQIPTEEELQALLLHTGMNLVEINPPVVTLHSGSKIDLGGIAKGYAAEQIAAIFQKYNIQQGWAALGGNVLALGTRPDNQPWQVGIQDPDHPEEEIFVGILGLSDAYAVTSGGYQRYFEKDGVQYHHILNPSNGRPAESGLTSVTVVADCQTAGNGSLCDALSTALFVMGADNAIHFWRSAPYTFEMVLVTDENTVFVTDGLDFTPTEESHYRYEIIS